LPTIYQKKHTHSQSHANITDVTIRTGIEKTEKYKSWNKRYREEKPLKLKEQEIFYNV